MEQSKKEDYQGTGATEVFEYENERSDLFAITQKNKKQYVGLQLSTPEGFQRDTPVLIFFLITQQ